MKKIIFTMLIAMLAACGQQGSNSEGIAGEGGSAVAGKYTLVLNADKDTLSNDSDAINVQVYVRNNETGQDVTGTMAKDVLFAVGDGLSYDSRTSSDGSMKPASTTSSSSGSAGGSGTGGSGTGGSGGAGTGSSSSAGTGTSQPVVIKGAAYVVKLAFGSNYVGESRIKAYIKGDSSVSKVVYIFRGKITVDAPKKAAAGSDVIVTSTLDSFSGELKGRQVTATLNGASLTKAADANGKVEFKFEKVANNTGENQEYQITVKDDATSISSSRNITVTPLGSESVEATIAKPLAKTKDGKYILSVDKEYSVTVKSSAAAQYDVSSTNVGLTISKSTIDANTTAQELFTVQHNIAGATANLAVTKKDKSSPSDSINLIFVPSKPNKIEFKAVPDTISVFGAGDADDKTASTSTLTARAVNGGNGVPDVKVVFKLAIDAKGSFEPSSGIATTDENGYASINYIAPATPQDSVKVSAGIPTDVCTGTYNDCTLEKTIKVKPRVLGLRVNWIGKLVADGIYMKREMVVSTDDGNGKPISGVDVKIQHVNKNIKTGEYEFASGKWTQSVKKDYPKDGSWGDATTGVLYDFKAGTKTDVSGMVNLFVKYPRSEATWAAVTLKVSASKGTQQEVRELPFEFYALQEDTSGDLANPPDFQFSPYGK